MERKRPTTSDNAGLDGSEMVAFTSSLQKSREKNRELQLEVVDALKGLNIKMAKNRRMASRLTQELHMENEKAKDAKPREFPKADVDVVRSLLEAAIEGKDESHVVDQGADPREEAKKLNRGLTPKKAQELWMADPYRVWKRQYFHDPLGTVPKPNPDIVKRRRITDAHAEERFFPNLSPPWIAQEQKLLDDFIKETNKQSPTATIDFQAAAKHVNNKRKVDTELPFRQPRTAKECEIQYQRKQAEKQPKISKAESKNIVEQVKRMKNDGQVDWEAVAESIGNGRTAWQCFVAYQKVIHSVPTQPNWTPQQDEILLKYIAAQGPQFVLDVTAVDDMCCKLFPDKTRRQIFLRANQSLVNPNFQSTPWSLQEERKLVLCQKVYKEASERVPVHFPIRSSRSVREKWSGNLDPSYTSEPWTKEEDEKLRQVVKEKLQEGKGGAANQCGGSISWADITREHFPNRRSDQIRSRWNHELATEEEMLQKIKADLAVSQGIGEHQDPAHLDDYVVKVVGKGKKRRDK